jgi:hypothetical protein
MTVACNRRSLSLYLSLSLALAAACSPVAPTEAELESRVSPHDGAPLAAVEPRALDDQLPALSTQGPAFTLVAEPSGDPGAADAAVVLGEVSRLRGVSKADIDKWRRTLDQIARVSKRGERAVILRRMVLDALEAPSDEEYRQILRGLRARMAAADVGVGDASTLARGGADFRVGSPLGLMPGPGQWGAAESAEAYSEAVDPEGSASGPHVDYVEALAEYLCSTTWEGVVYEDECATQEEIDDALAIGEALEAELSADYSEAQTVCLNIYGNECPAATEEESSQVTLTGSFNTWFASPTSQVTESDMAERDDREDAGGFPCGAAEGPFDTAQAAELGCASEAAAAVGAMGGFVVSWLGGESLLRSGALARGGVFAIKAGLIGVAFGTGYFIGSWLNCMI